MNKVIPIILAFMATPIFAYIGPGMGGGALAAIIGFFAAIIIGIWGILYYPIKRFIKNKKKSKDEQ